MKALWKMRARLAVAPRCGAHAKSSGEPCKQLALTNGRCRYHGGRSPKGAQWHVPQLTNPGKSVAKLDKKLSELNRRQTRRVVAEKNRTTDQQAAHARWKASKAPGSVASRRRANAQRKYDAEARALIEALEARQAAPLPPSLSERQIAKLKRVIALAELPEIFS